MSIAALLKGVETRLRSAEVLDDQPGEEVGKLCGVTVAPGRPHPNFGQLFYSVHWSGGRGNDRNPQRHDVLAAVTVTITAKMANVPRDRRGLRATTPAELMDLVDQVAGPDVIHGNYDVLAHANRLIEGTAEWVALHQPGGTATVNGYVEPLVLLDFGPEREATPDWVASRSGDADNVYVIPVRFGDARRIRPYAG